MMYKYKLIGRYKLFKTDTSLLRLYEFSVGGNWERHLVSNNEAMGATHKGQDIAVIRKAIQSTNIRRFRDLDLDTDRTSIYNPIFLALSNDGLENQFRVRRALNALEAYEEQRLLMRRALRDLKW